jgi:hypothetical protein
LAALIGRRPQRYLVSEGFDIALCIAELADSASAAVKIASGRRSAVAMLAHLRQNGIPQMPAGIAKHRSPCPLRELPVINLSAACSIGWQANPKARALADGLESIVRKSNALNWR